MDNNNINNTITYEDVFPDNTWDKPVYPCWSIRVGNEDNQRYELGEEEEVIAEINRQKSNILAYYSVDDEDDITITLFYELDENTIRTHYEITIDLKEWSKINKAV